MFMFNLSKRRKVIQVYYSRFANIPDTKCLFKGYVEKLHTVGTDLTSLSSLYDFHVIIEERIDFQYES